MISKELLHMLLLVADGDIINVNVCKAGEIDFLHEIKQPSNLNCKHHKTKATVCRAVSDESSRELCTIQAPHC